MIKEGILIAGIAFYTFVISSLIRDIRNPSSTQVMRTSASLS
jgi:hypothetical protein